MKFVLLLLFAGSIASAAPVSKYHGSLAVVPNTIHKEGVKGQIDLLFEGDNFSRLELTTEKPIYGKTQFSSVEQAIFSRIDSGKVQLAVVFKLQGPPHKWYFVFVGTRGEQEPVFSGQLLKALAPMDKITAALTSGQLPQDWKPVGQISLTQLSE